MKAKQTIYVHKKKVYIILDKIFKNSSNFFKLSYIFPLRSKISPVTPYFCTCVKFAYTYLFDADLTDPDASRNILDSSKGYFRNSIRSRIHLFNPRVTFTRIGRVIYNLSDIFWYADVRYAQMKRNSCWGKSRVSRFSFSFTIA